MSTFDNKPTDAQVIEMLREKFEPNEIPQVWVCQGPPRCDLQDMAAVEAMQSGCKFCKTIVCHPDGTETITEPSYAN